MSSTPILPPLPVQAKCKHCDKQRNMHQANTLACPIDKNTKIGGYDNYYTYKALHVETKKKNVERITLPNGNTCEISIITKVPKNFDEFRKNWCQYFADDKKVEEPTFIPCTNPLCRGAGNYYDPEDPPCPIEGNKLRRRIKCPTCKGTGRGVKAVLFKLYQEAKDDLQLTHNLEIYQIKSAQNALEKISAEEWMYLKKVGINLNATPW